MCSSTAHLIPGKGNGGGAGAAYEAGRESQPTQREQRNSAEAMRLAGSAGVTDNAWMRKARRDHAELG